LLTTQDTVFYEKITTHRFCGSLFIQRLTFSGGETYRLRSTSHYLISANHCLISAIDLRLICCPYNTKIKKLKEDFLLWKTKTNALISYAIAVSETTINTAATIVEMR